MPYSGVRARAQLERGEGRGEREEGRGERGEGGGERVAVTEPHTIKVA